MESTSASRDTLLELCATFFDSSNNVGRLSGNTFKRIVSFILHSVWLLRLAVVVRALKGTKPAWSLLRHRSSLPSTSALSQRVLLGYAKVNNLNPIKNMVIKVRGTIR